MIYVPVYRYKWTHIMRYKSINLLLKVGSILILAPAGLVAFASSPASAAVASATPIYVQDSNGFTAATPLPIGGARRAQPVIATASA